MSRSSGTGLARATLLGFLSEALVFPAGLITAAYLTRTLGAGPYGQLSLLYAVLSPVVWLASSTFAGRAGVKLLADATDPEEMGAVLMRANLAFGLTIALAFAAAVPWLASSLHHPDLAPLLWAAAFEIVLMPLSRLHRDALAARGFYAWPALATAVYQVTRLALVLVLVAAGWGLAGVIVANLVARGLELAACRRRVRPGLRGGPTAALASSGRFFGSVFAFSLCIQLFNRVDMILLGLLDAPAQTLGYYGAAQNLAQAPGLLALVLSPLLIAALRRADLGGEIGRAEELRTHSSRLAVALWAFAAPVAAGAGGLAAVLFGPAFTPAGPMLAWLGCSGGAWLVVSVHSAHEVARGRYWRPLFAAVPMLGLAVLLQLLLIPGHGGLGAAWATAGAAGGAALGALGFAGTRGLASRVVDLARAAGAGAAGYAGTRVALAAGVPPPADLVAGCAVTGVALVAVGLTTTGEVRRIVAGLTGLDRPSTPKDHA